MAFEITCKVKQSSAGPQGWEDEVNCSKTFEMKVSDLCGHGSGSPAGA